MLAFHALMILNYSTDVNTKSSDCIFSQCLYFLALDLDLNWEEEYYDHIIAVLLPSWPTA